MKERLIQLPLPNFPKELLPPEVEIPTEEEQIEPERWAFEDHDISDPLQTRYFHELGA